MSALAAREARKGLAGIFCISNGPVQQGQDRAASGKTAHSASQPCNEATSPSRHCSGCEGFPTASVDMRHS